MERVEELEVIKACAEENSKKNPLDLKRGDYVFAIAGGTNCHNLMEWLEAKRLSDGSSDTILCKIDNIIRFPQHYNLVGGWTARAAIGTFEQDTEIYESVTVLRKDTGEWVAVNPQNSHIWAMFIYPLITKKCFQKSMPTRLLKNYIYDYVII